jgi:hypothetical protein
MALWMPYVAVIYTIAFVVITALVNEQSALYKALPWLRKPPVFISNRYVHQGSQAPCCPPQPTDVYVESRHGASSSPHLLHGDTSPC